ncbi:unnamed protein product [Tilletia laevis]|nr:unnamed protein product [Tilletia laevis]
MVRILSTLTSIALVAAVASAIPLEERSVKVVHDNDGVDAKGAKIGLNLLNNLHLFDDGHILKRKATKIVHDNDLVDAKNLKLNLNLLNDLDILKRKATTFVHDNDLVDAKGLKLGLNLLNDIDLLKRKATSFVDDDDLIDLKNTKINLDLLKNLHILKRGSNALDAIIARSEDKAVEARGCSTNVVHDNDLIDLKNLKAVLNVLSRSTPEKRGSKSVSYSDNDLLDLKDLGVNVNILSGRPQYCVPVPHTPKPTQKPTRTPKPTPKPTRTPKPTTTRKPTTTKHTTTKKHITTKHTPKPTQKPPTSCPSGFDHVSHGSTCGSVYESDNDLIDLKDLTINVCILDFSGKCGKDSGKKSPSWTCQTAGGCCVQKGTKSTTVVDDDDLFDLKNIGINLGLLNF